MSVRRRGGLQQSLPERMAAEAARNGLADETQAVIAVKHGGHRVAENLALCCSLCNRYKGSDIASIDPETGELTPLFHPRVDRWEEHFQVCDGVIVGLTLKGRATARLLRMNRSTRIKERQLLQH